MSVTTQDFVSSSERNDGKFNVLDKEIPNGFPQIIQNPGMKVVEKGRNAVLVCEAGGDPNPTVTWIKVRKHLIHVCTVSSKDPQGLWLQN